ncbi:blue light receptor [Colletotrichum incanum]|uniref:Blue light receptor n=1 Tax=Colletotrichum incanum TaxID=1573173 RepID=A0A167A4T0_COLIC|nr:blue light receptor [Colletotrichum incanum]OHX01229.1 blue light receptor [Colletotrichum incanum]
MAAGYDADDDAAAFTPSGNGNAPKAIPTGSIDDELLSKVLPRVDTAAIEAARIAIGQESEDSDEDYTRPQLRRSLSESSVLIGHGAVGDHSDSIQDTALETRKGTAPTGPREASRSARESVELGRSSRPLSRTDMVPQSFPSRPHTRSGRESVAVPTRRSSRPDRAIDSPDRIARQRDYNTPQRPPRAEEIEAARRLLAQVSEAEEYSIRDEGEKPPRAFRSATPPPIGGRRRRIVYDDSEEEEETFDGHGDETDHDYHEYRNEHRNGNRDIATTPVTAIYQATEDTSRPPPAHHRYTRDHLDASRTSSRQSSQPPPRSRAAESFAAHKRGLRTPVLDHNRLYQDAEPPPISQRRSRNPRPRRATLKENPDMDEEAFQDYSVKNGLGATLTPDYRPATTERRAMSDDSMSISRQSTSKHSMTSSGSSRGVDFLGPGIFQIVLHNPTTVHQLLKFAEARFCSESVEFLKKVEQYQTVLNDLAGIMTSIHKDFLSEDSSKQINVNGELRKSVHSNMKSLVTKTLPSMETLFSDLQESVEQDVFLDIYPRFVRYQMALSATRALASNRHSYQGLGDCFCLTNPGLADNPIVFASDGFIKVTGYKRPEIIPRNCRFLQGAHTDRAPVRRLKIAIEERKESVELILNYKKNGDPFWNLLYVAPLYNETGKLAFFIGGQINCSTTIHSNADVMKVLSASSNDDVEVAAKAPPLLHRAGSVPSARKAFLKALGVKFDGHGPNASAIDPGMESKLLHKLEGRDLSTQMKEFHTAYSKASKPQHRNLFYSEGVLDMLHPANNTVGLVAGQDVFRFLKQNMVNHQSDYKTRVRNGIRAGAPVSVEVRLQTRRSALFRGDERFMTHWTPLKDEKSVVHWIVITMAPTIQ